MKPLLLFCSVSLLTATPAVSQNMRLPLTSVYPSLTAYSAQFSDALAVQANVAALANVKKPSVGLFSERRFLLAELSGHSLAVGLPTRSGHFGFTAGYQGQAAFHSAEAGLAYARVLGDRLGLGLRFTYALQAAAGYGRAAAVGVDGGFLVRLAPNFQVGVQAAHPGRARLGRSDERLPAVYAFGMGYDASPQLYLAAGVLKAEDGPLAVQAGLQYRVADRLLARIGINTGNTVFCAGVGLQLASLQLQFTSSFHPQLGLTPGLLLVYQKKE